MSSELCKDSDDFLNILLGIHCTYRDFKDYFDYFLDLAVEMPSIIFRNITDKNEIVADISVSLSGYLYLLPIIFSI